ncbi:MAG: Plug domain-containing protein, partial [Myxococcota bacterium]
MLKRTRHRGWSGITVAALLSTQVAEAQPTTTSTQAGDSSAPAETAEDAIGVEEIVVTATRRKTRLIDTPVAVTAVSMDNLAQRNVTNSLSLEKLVPSLKVQDQRTLGMGAVQFTIRGIGNTNFTEQGDPNVGFHVDGVYLSRPQAAMAFLFDLE